MKPRVVTMQAFGAYLERTAVDFTRLYTGGIFLITGPTGSGKTTILDAISYALYGCAAGSLRDARDMRSSAAPETLDTVVSYSFELNGSIYEFERSRRIRRVRHRDGGTETVQDTEAACYEVKDGRKILLADGAAVEKKAVELLGFSHEQFSQVVVLPQGEFRKLLTASSTEKQKILEALFGMSRWQLFVKSLAEKTKELEKGLEQCRSQSAAVLSGAGAETREALEIRLSQTRAEIDEIEKKSPELEKTYRQAADAMAAADRLNQAFDELDGVKKKLLALRLEQRAVDDKKAKLEAAEKAERLLDLYNAVKAAKKRLEDAEKAKAEAQAAEEKASGRLAAARTNSEKYAGADEAVIRLSAEKTKLEGMLKPAADLVRAAAEYEHAEKTVATVKKSREEAEKRKNELTAELENASKQVKENFETRIKPLPALKAEKIRLEGVCEVFAKREAQSKLTLSLNARLLKKRGEYRALSQQLKNEQRVLDGMKAMLLDDAAFELSQGLEDGAPCPVCGSVHHPKRAAPAHGAPDRQALETQSGIVSGLSAKLEAVMKDGGDLSGRNSAEKTRLAEIESECAKSGTDADGAHAGLVQVTRALGECAEAESHQGQLEKHEAELKLLRSEAETREKNAADSLADAQSALSAAGARLRELSAAVPEALRISGVIEQRIAALDARSRELATGAERASAEHHAAENSLAAGRERVAAAEHAAAGAAGTLENAQKEFRARLAASGLAEDCDITLLVMGRDEKKASAEAVRNYDNELYAGQEKEKALTEKLAEQKRPAVSELRAEVESKRALIEQSARTKGGLEAAVKTLSASAGTLGALQNRYDMLEKDYSLYSRVLHLTSGDNPLKTPIYQFVLGIMLDDVLSCANQHLALMSRGRYALQRNAGSSRGNGTKGLDLNVNDAWGGGERTVNTLSGGEMFLASLSLAFGLSDVVQAYSGGIRLDSIFIDEGFGSLDTETLDTAMRALESLPRAGRLVGIISHVDELASRITAHIEVKRHADGVSTAAAYPGA